MEMQGSHMKEVLTKSFWQGVKKTFHDALEDPPPTENASQIPADPSASSTPEDRKITS
jgi:hypothetical protein